ncbi:MAG: hypothetical protein M3151_13770, partial [Actinomycetota bacterium]|nr:hypothetical protein [Actinomycetota bacterium]
MSAAVHVGQPVRERSGTKPGDGQAPAAPSGFSDAGRYSAAARKPRRGASGADGRARERRYPLYEDQDLMALVGWGDAAAFAVLY